MMNKDRGYVLKCNSNKNKQLLHTVAFCRDDKNFKMMNQEKVKNFSDRIFMFEYKDFVIIDAHMPLNPKDDESYSENKKKRAENVEKQWEDIKEYLEKKKDEKVIFMGDLNVYQRETHQYESFGPLFESDVDMQDLWLKQGGKSYDKNHGLDTL